MLLNDIIITSLLVEEALPMEDIKIYGNGRNIIKASFIVGDVKIYFYTRLTSGELSIVFGTKDANSSDKDKDAENYDMLNIGYKHARTVMDTISMLVRYVMEKHGSAVDVVRFSGKGRSRISMYLKLGKQLEQAGYTKRNTNGKNGYVNFVYVSADYLDTYDYRYGESSVN